MPFANWFSLEEKKIDESGEIEDLFLPPSAF